MEPRLERLELRRARLLLRADDAHLRDALDADALASIWAEARKLARDGGIAEAVAP